MTPFRKLARTALVAALVLGGGSAHAGWDNVFQVCCNGCRSSTSAASPLVAVPVSDGGQPCTTRYVQRSYYQPVTTYQARTVVEPVTSYRISYYYEPVTSYRVSSYYDPNSCGYQQVTTPVVSYRLRSQSCPVTSYYQRSMLQPVQSYQLAYYFEPQTTCCQTTIGAPVVAPPAPGAVAVPFSPPPGAAAVPLNPAVSGPPTVGEQRQPQMAVPPGVSEQRQPQLAVPPGVSEQRDAPPDVSESQRYAAPPSSQPMPRAPETSTFRPTAPTPPSVRLDRIVSASAPLLQGQIVSEDRQPVPHVQLLFILADKMSTRESVTADVSGKFQLTLAAGSWLVYTQTPDGRTDFRRKIEVRADEPTELRLVSR
jgi:hypothetical protein